MVSPALLGQLDWWVIITDLVIYSFSVGKLLLRELRFEFTVLLVYSTSVFKYSCEQAHLKVNLQEVGYLANYSAVNSSLSL